jgi:hypothetical protein
MLWKLLLIPCFLCSGALLGSTQADLLQEQIGLADAVASHVEPQDQGRLFQLRQMAVQLVSALTDPLKGPGHEETTRRQETYFTHYLNSHSFFKQIETRATARAIARIQTIAETSATALGYTSAVPNTTHTQEMCEHVQEVAAQLEKQAIPEELKEVLTGLNSRLVDCAGRGGRDEHFGMGDTYPVYQHVLPLCESLRALYPRFYPLRRSNPSAYQTFLDLQGTVDWYLFITQIGMALDKRRDTANPLLEGKR